MQLRLNQAGDTIVEVLVAIAVVSAVLGTAYSITNRSTRTNQQSQEHSKALKVAETQLENLRAWSQTDNTILDGTDTFCMASTGPVSFGGNVVLPAAAGTYPAACHEDDGAATDRYQTGIKRDGNDTYTAHVDWTGPTGGNESVNLTYKVYK